MTLPTTSLFSQALNTLTNILTDYSLELDTKKGSAIRLLVIRPYAYLYSFVNRLISSWLLDTSVATLSKSVLTSNSTADTVASNYFITRKLGAKAKGVITVTCNVPLIRFPIGTKFSVDGTIFTTTKMCLAVPSPSADTDTINYIKMYTYGTGVYKANIPVEALLSVYMLIPLGVLVSLVSYVAGTVSCALTSPITGGNLALTDASMLQRCKERCGVSINTDNTLKLALLLAPIEIKGLSITGSNQAGCFKSRYNNLDIASGYSLDAYIKTQNTTSSTTVLITSFLSDSEGLFADITYASYPDICGAVRVVSVSSPNKTQLEYTVLYLSDTLDISTECARLSKNQKIRIRPVDIVLKILVQVLYMPGLNYVADFAAQDINTFVGLDYTIKSAVPATIKLQAQINSSILLSEDSLNAIKQNIAEYINNLLVGYNRINMDLIALIILNLYPDIKMRLPYLITCSLPTTNGELYSFSTTDGTLDLNYRKSLYCWLTSIYYLYTAPSLISLQVVE